MAEVALATNAVPKRNVAGTTIAARDLEGVTSTANDEVAICEVPIGSLVTAIDMQSSINLGNVQIGIEGDNVTDDPDFFRAAAASGANAKVSGDLRLPYKVETEGERITFTSVNAVSAVSTGVAAATYTLDGFVS